METAVAASTGIEKILSSSTSFSLHRPSLNSLHLHCIFDLFDKNDDGIITIQEISQALSLLGIEADFSNLESTIKSHIKPDNVGLSFEDFISLHNTIEQSFFVYINESGEGAVNDGDDQVRMQQEESDKDSGSKMENLAPELLINQTEERHHGLGFMESNIFDMNRYELDPYCVIGNNDVSKSNLCSMVPDTMGTVVPEIGEFGIDRWSTDLEEKLES